MQNLFIDLETFSSVDIKTAGLYKYTAAFDFEIILFSYAFDDGELITLDLTENEIPDSLRKALVNPNIVKHAHNATFERVCLARVGIEVPIDQWECTAVLSGYCGLPISLGEVSKVLDLANKKLESGAILIKYFSCPAKPVHNNNYRTRNMPTDAALKWQQYINYNRQDVLAEREIYNLLKQYSLPPFEQALYRLDQKINDIGVRISVDMASNAIEIDSWYTNIVLARLKQITGLSNPNSVIQLSTWIEDKTGDYVEDLTKDNVKALLERYTSDPVIVEVLEGRQVLSKTSIKKYIAMLNTITMDLRARGLFQFYGTRTGRWAGRLIQLQNLPQNHIRDLDLARNCVLDKDGDTLGLLYGNVSSILSQLIRTAFVPEPNHIYHIADFSAIEARVVAWLADEDWRLEVFRGDGKIYEASGARIFGVPISEITKGSELRHKAKTAELALGYQGSIGAMKRMGGEAMGLSDGEMTSIVKKWRAANPNIVKLWDDYDSCAIEAVMYNTAVVSALHGIVFECKDELLSVELPSGHKIYYQKPTIVTNKFNKAAVSYLGVIQETRQWGRMDTYGGKLTENIVQAFARDLLGYSMLRLDEAGYQIVMHIHDEVVIEAPDVNSEETLKHICDIMGAEVPWAPGLPLNAEGFSSYYYKKD